MLHNPTFQYYCVSINVLLTKRRTYLHSITLMLRIPFLCKIYRMQVYNQQKTNLIQLLISYIMINKTCTVNTV